MDIEYYLTPNPLKLGSLRAVLLPGDKASFEAFLKHCEIASTVGRADALAVVEMMAGWVEQQAGEGREVDFGPLGQTRLGVAGSFQPDAESIRPDQWRLTIGWQVGRRLQGRVDRAGKRAGLRRRPPPNHGPYVASVVDMMTGAPDSYSPGGLLELRGSRLKFDAGQSDEGVFLRPAAGGAEVRLDRYLTIHPKTIQAQVPTPLVGLQCLIVRRRLRPRQPRPSQATYDKTLTPA